MTTINRYIETLTTIEDYKIINKTNDSFDDQFDFIALLINTFYKDELKTKYNVDDALDLPMSVFNYYSNQFNYLTEEIKKEAIKNHYLIDGVKYEFEPTFVDWTAGQYIDFIEITKEYNKEFDYIYNLPMILSLFLKPKDGKPIKNREKFIDDIGESISIQEGLGMLFFCELAYKLLTNNIQDSSKKKKQKNLKMMNKQKNWLDKLLHRNSHSGL